MSFVRYATAEIIGVKGSEKRLGRQASLDKFADYDDYRTDDGYIYVRVRAISSRVNKNHDGWPSAELAKSYRTFLGKPIFVDHNNSDPKRMRGVVVDAKLHVEEPGKTSALDPYYSSAPVEHMPPTWIELLLETDAKTFPKLAADIVSGAIDGVSMGCNVERSKCSHCANWATVPEQYCQHIREKGAEFDYYRDGHKTSKKSYEDCYDIGFFEISYVFDPADETALFLESPRTSSMQKVAGVGNLGAIPPHEQTKYMSPDEVAETVDGITPETYGALWGLSNQLEQEGRATPIGGDRHDPYGEHGYPTVEDPQSARDVMMGNKGTVADLWDRLDPEHQQNINDSLNKQDAEYAQYRDAKTADSNPAAYARKDKEAHPDQYCPQCLWKTGGGPCPRHGGPERGQDSSGADTGPIKTAAPEVPGQMDTGFMNLIDDAAMATQNGGQQQQQQQGGRPLSDIAQEVYANWPKVNYAAKPYLDAMSSMNSIDDNYGMDDGRSVVLYFLSNARSWKGPVAAQVKAELKGMLKNSKVSAVKKADGYDQVYHGDSDDEGYGGMHGIMGADEPAAGEAYCPACGGPGMHMGQLGHLNHFRCRNCGTDFSMNGNEPREHMPHDAAVSDEEQDEDDVNEYEKRRKQLQDDSTTSAKKPEGDCPTCGSNSIDWWGAGSEGQCRNCGHHITEDSMKEASVHKSDTDQLPQAELLHAPDKVDTLRQEQVCPVCGNQIDDGKCNVCGFEEPPEGFGNPDLQKAQEVNQEQEAADMAQPGPGGQPPVPVPGGGDQGSPPPGPSPMGAAGPGQSAMPLQAAASVNVRSEKTSAIGGGTQGKPILPVTQQLTDKPKNEKRIKDSAKPVVSSSREETMTDKRTAAPDNVADRLKSERHRTEVENVDSVGGGISEENPIGHKNVNVEGVGAVDNDENPEGHKEESLDSSLREEVGGPTSTWSGGEGDSLGQHSPVGSEGDHSLASTKHSLQIFPVNDPKSVKLDAGLKEEVGPPTSTFGSDDFHITDPVTNDPFPASKDGVRPEGAGVPDKSPFPPANEGVKPEGAGTPDKGGFPPASEGVKAARRQFMASLRLAETEVALGIIPAEKKLDRMAELEDETAESLESQLSAYSKVKTAGLTKAAKKTGGSLPSLKQSSVDRESSIRQVEAHDETVELAESIFS